MISLQHHLPGGNLLSHRLNPGDGFGIQRVYTDDGTLDETMAVRNGDVVLVRGATIPAARPMGSKCTT